MIETEDREFSDFSLREGDIAVPVEIYQPANATEITVTVYENFREIADTYQQNFFNEPFGSEAIAYLENALRSPMQMYDMSASVDAVVGIREYRMDRPEDLRESCILEGTRLIMHPQEWKNIKNHTTHTFADESAAIYLNEDGILAVAAENDYSDSEMEREIHVECAVGYRNRGLATSCAALLTKQFLHEGYSVLYKCRNSNLASRKVAEKTGFSYTGTRMSFVYYRNSFL